MKKLLLNLLALACFTVTAVGQDFPYGEINAAELNLKKYAKDTSAHAFVINEFGVTRLNVMSDNYTRVIHEYHVKIKILDEKAFDKGTVEIPFRPSNSAVTEETVSDIKGITTYADDRGDLQTAVLDPSKIVVIKQNKYVSTTKFTMPNLRKGCIIEYQYRFISPYFDRFPNWEFQDDIPKAYSEYEVHIPGFWTYNVSMRGSLKLTKNTSEVEKECYTTRGATADCSFIKYGMADIPAFIEEDYMTSPNNFKSAIYFQAEQYKSPYNGVVNKYTKEWKDVDLMYKRSDYFGAQLRKRDVFKENILPLIAGKTGELEKAKIVYAFIQKNIKWNKGNGSMSESIKKTFENHSGDAGDINLALINALRTAGINTEAVLLSTRANGLINRLYPVDDGFNYVIARATIDTTVYLLDATDPLMPFGMIPIKCLNDQGRLMTLDKPSDWVDIKVNQKQSSTSSLDLTMQPNGKLKGTIVTYSAGYEAFDKRTKIKKFNTVDEYVEDMDEKLTKLKVLKYEMTNLDSIDQPLAEKYDVEIDLYDNLNSTRLAFNPVIMDRTVTNPFKLTERNYPVDMGVPSSSRYILNLHFPDGYVIESSPQPVAISLPNRGGSYQNEFTGQGNTFVFSNVFLLNHSIYMPEEYPYLKELYNKIIAAEKAEIVIKKK